MLHPFHQSLMASSENGEKDSNLGKIFSGRSTSSSSICCSGDCSSSCSSSISCSSSSSSSSSSRISR